MKYIAWNLKYEVSLTFYFSELRLQCLIIEYCDLNTHLYTIKVTDK